MAAGTWVMVDIAKKYFTDGTLDWDANPLKVALVASTSNISTTSTIFGSVTNELATANGYTAGGVTVTTPSITVATGTTKLTASAIPAWTASGGSIVARWAVLYASGTLNTVVNPVIGYVLLDSTPADVTVTTGNTLTISIPANGFFTLT